ncbi:MAG: sugar ABC transporter substrate-binding protein [Oscillospiraceae bacterium]
MGKKQMKWFLAVSVVLIAALLAATALIEQPDEQMSSMPLALSFEYHFAINIGSPDTSFAEQFLAGAEQEAQKWNVALEVAELNSAYADNGTPFEVWADYCNIDAIIVSAAPSAKESSLEPFSAIPCISIRNDALPDSSAYVGSDNYQVGYDLGEALCKKGMNLTAALLLPEKEDQAVSSTLKGLYDALEAGKTVTIVDTVYTKSDLLTAMSAAETLLLLPNGSPDYILCLDETLISGAVRGIIDLNRVNSVDVAGIGYSDEIETYIQSGIVQITVNTDPFRMGELAVQTAVRACRGELDTAAQEYLIPHTVVS